MAGSLYNHLKTYINIIVFKMTETTADNLSQCSKSIVLRIITNRVTISNHQLVVQQYIGIARSYVL
jgi:hypothetical protein